MAQWLTLFSPCRQHGFHLWSENLRSRMPHGKATWQVGETVETVADINLGGSKITADDD